jgi:hypothetical protein
VGKEMKKDANPQQFSKDTPVVLLLILNGALVMVSILSVLLRLRPNDFKVPIQYIVYNGTVVQSGNWYSLIGFVLFLIAGAALTFVMAHRLYKANRFFTMAVLASYTMVGVFALLTINALLSLVERV